MAKSTDFIHLSDCSFRACDVRLIRETEDGSAVITIMLPKGSSLGFMPSWEYRDIRSRSTAELVIEMVKKANEEASE